MYCQHFSAQLANHRLASRYWDWDFLPRLHSVSSLGVYFLQRLPRASCIEPIYHTSEKEKVKEQHTTWRILVTLHKVYKGQINYLLDNHWLYSNYKIIM